MDKTFCIKIPIDNPEKMQKFQLFMNAWQDSMIDYEIKIKKELNCSSHCASDIVYLRSRSRWNQQLENKLVELDRLGKHPPVLAGWNGESEEEWDKI